MIHQGGDRAQHARRLIVLFLLSFAFKVAGVGYLTATHGSELDPPDTRNLYAPLAHGLLAGEGYHLAGDYRDATRVPPVFPLYLAAVHGLLGSDVPALGIGILNSVFRGWTTLLVYLLGRRLFGEETGLAAGLLHACDPWEAFWAAFPLKESLAVFLFVLTVWWLLRTLDHPSWARGFLAGAGLGVASLARYATLGFYPFAVMLLAGRVHRSGLTLGAATRLAAIFTLGTLASLCPWLARNQRLFGEPVISTHLAGRYFYVANGPGVVQAPDTSGYSGRALPDAAFIREMERSAEGPAAREWAFFRQTIRHLAIDPAAVAALLRTKLVNQWRPTFEGASLANQVVLGGSYAAFMMLSIAGLALSWKRRSGLALPLAVVAFYLLTHLLFFAEIRYRQYLTPFLALFAGQTLAAGWKRIAVAPRPTHG